MRLRFLALVLASLATLPAVAGAQSPARSPAYDLVRGTPSVDPRIGIPRDERIAAALADVSPARLRAIDSALVSFRTRHTMSDTLSPTRGIGAARRWIHAELSRYAADCKGCLRVEYDAGMVTVDRHPDKPSVNVVNVLAWLKGRDTSRVLVIGGHYDSCVCAKGGAMARFDTTSDAPGADDDGSGTAAVMELARVVAKHYPRGLETSVVFALYSGEELGLLGSTQLAKRLQAGGYEIVAGMTDDIIGNVVAEDGRVDSTSVRIFAPGDTGARGDDDVSPSRELGRYVWAMGAVYMPGFEVRPTWRLDRIGRGGDHRPFWAIGAPALRFSERLENYRRQHLGTDRLEDVSFEYVAKVARLNLATVASLAQAPAPPDSVTYRRDAASGGQKWQVTWTPSKHALNYEVLVRRTTLPTYERVIRVAGVTTYLLDEQLDDAWVAVRAVSPGGHRSIGTVATGFTR